LRSRFDSGPSGQLGEVETEGSDADDLSDYFGQAVKTGHRVSSLPRNTDMKTPKLESHTLPPVGSSERLVAPEVSDPDPTTPRTATRTNRSMYVNAGDLHSMAGTVSDAPRPYRVYNALHGGSSRHGDTSSRRSLSTTRSSVSGHLGAGDFDLRAEVMSCIAKSIGLIQPPHLGHGECESETADPSPGVPPFSASSSDAGGGSSNMFNSSFGSLSMLEVDMGVGDDASSTSASGTGIESQPLLGFDNEVEILSFDAGSTLVMAGERNAGLYSSLECSLSHNQSQGLFYVIDGLLDVSMPSDDPGKTKDKSETTKSSAGTKPTPFSQSRLDGISNNSTSVPPKPIKSHKHLFTVKPGGIAGYLGAIVLPSHDM
jgi:lysophospholipid hydrolase